MATAANALTLIEEGVAIATQVGNVLIPAIKGIVKSVQTKIGDATGTVEYTIVIQTGQSNLQHADDDFNDSLNKINIEREKVGLPPIIGPFTTPPTP